MEDIKEVLELVCDLKERGVTGGSVARTSCRRLIQPIKDRVHPAYEYWGQSYPAREVNRKVPQGEMMARVSQIYVVRAKIKKCPKSYSLTRPSDLISSGTSRSFVLFFCLRRPYSFVLMCCMLERCSYGAQHPFL
jgi:hypothetical protein